MQVVVFEDDAVAGLGVVAVARPACDLTLGGSTLADALLHLGGVDRAVRPHLARHIVAVAGRRPTLWGTTISIETPPAMASTHGATVLAVNARMVPSRTNIQSLRSLVEAGHRGIVLDGESLAAAILHLDADGGGPDRRALSELIATRSTSAIEACCPDHLDAALELLHEPHEIISAHEQSLTGSLAMLIDSGRFRELRPGLFAAEGASIAEQVVVRQGPVVVEGGAEIGPFVCLDGPLLVGPEARVNPHAWLRAGTVIGRACRVGGEVEATVLEPFSNKPHDGFLGHSHLGSWVNIAAGTITSNLKASYGPIRLRQDDRTIETGRQFLGAMIGDLAKTAINTSIPCGCRIGVAATIGGSVPETVPAFQNLLVDAPAGSTTSPAQAEAALERMMARRGLEILPADRDLIASLAGFGADYTRE
jgi:glucose-1-phosphate thymidylyltransferase